MGYEINAYKVLGLDETATIEEVETAYKELCKKYEDERFLPGQAGEDAAERLEQIKVAYNDIVNFEKTQEQTFNTDETYKAVQNEIQSGNLEKAQELLDLCNFRDAEWHFLQSVVYFKKSWYLESKKQLEVAVQMDPTNERYISSLKKLMHIISSNSISPDQLRTTTEQPRTTTHSNGTCTGSFCGDICVANMCCDCMRCGFGC